MLSMNSYKLITETFLSIQDLSLFIKYSEETLEGYHLQENLMQLSLPLPFKGDACIRVYLFS